MSDFNDTSTEKIAVILIIIGLALMLPCMYMRYRQRKRTTLVFGHYRSISRNLAHSRRQSAPSRLEQVVVGTTVETDANSIHNSILPRYDIDKAPPAYGEAPPYTEAANDLTGRYSVDITDMYRPTNVPS
ncbi:hypothetical protein NQZ79_g2404 [Umbelopsis isabellina]|nr:hypothetical protein NQZ79_g2404 [Umbelopsis isabellina]